VRDLSFYKKVLTEHFFMKVSLWQLSLVVIYYQPKQGTIMNLISTNPLVDIALIWAIGYVIFIAFFWGLFRRPKINEVIFMMKWPVITIQFIWDVFIVASLQQLLMKIGFNNFKKGK
jgi:hypothetical protein